MTPDEIKALCERLRLFADWREDSMGGLLQRAGAMPREAATALEALSTDIARITAERDEARIAARIECKVGQLDRLFIGKGEYVRADEVLKVMASAQAERDAAVNLAAEHAQARGEAEGRLRISEQAGMVEQWREKAERMEVERDAAVAEVERRSTATREEELRIHALGAAISRREWSEVERAHAVIRDEFHARQREIARAAIRTRNEEAAGGLTVHEPDHREVVMRRFGKRHEKPCNRPETLTCARWECQIANVCQADPGETP